MGRHWDKWARRAGVELYRIYDRDIPHFPLAIDRAGDYVIVQVYGGKIPEEEFDSRISTAVQTIGEALEIREETIILKIRERQRGRSQYERMDERSIRITVREGGLKFLLNVTDYLDIGLFADHRITRDMVRRDASGKSVLNLFAYTGSFTVYAADGVALKTTTVDMSNTYTLWAEENFRLNGFEPSKDHRFITSDVFQWLREAPAHAYDIIVLDPPTFSNSKRMDSDWDVQRDHSQLLDQVTRLLRPGGCLYFSTNKKGFQMEWSAPKPFVVSDITKATTPPDFQRRPRQSVFLIR